MDYPREVHGLWRQQTGVAFVHGCRGCRGRRLAGDHSGDHAGVAAPSTYPGRPLPAYGPGPSTDGRWRSKVIAGTIIGGWTQPTYRDDPGRVVSSEHVTEQVRGDNGAGANPKPYTQYAATGSDRANATNPVVRWTRPSHRGAPVMPGSRPYSHSAVTACVAAGARTTRIPLVMRLTQPRQHIPVSVNRQPRLTSNPHAPPHLTPSTAPRPWRLRHRAAAPPPAPATYDH